jgi:hypothetical protein
MSIRPPSDLVIDVVRAADPARAAAASQRLARAEAATPAGSLAPFDARMNVAAAKAAPGVNANSSANANAKVGQGLEELLMRQMLQDALPKKAEAVFGAGTAGEIWRGFFAEHLAHALSASGRVGLSARIVKTGGAA